MVCQELGLSKSSLILWLRAYRKDGQAGLRCPYAGTRTARLPAPITDKIIELKQQNPTFGIKRISQVLRRCFFLPASPETVRHRLHEAELMSEPPPSKKRNMVRPRFFELTKWTYKATFRVGDEQAGLWCTPLTITVPA